MYVQGWPERDSSCVYGVSATEQVCRGSVAQINRQVQHTRGGLQSFVALAARMMLSTSL
jgi:hypothetical protein